MRSLLLHSNLEHGERRLKYGLPLDQKDSIPPKLTVNVLDARRDWRAAALS